MNQTGQSLPNTPCFATGLHVVFNKVSGISGIWSLKRLVQGILVVLETFRNVCLWSVLYFDLQQYLSKTFVKQFLGQVLKESHSWIEFSFYN